MNSSGPSLIEGAVNYLIEEIPDGGNDVGDSFDSSTNEIGETPVVTADDTATVPSDAVDVVPSEPQTTAETPAIP